MKPGPWATPFDRTVQPGLRANMVQHADGHSTILRPRKESGITSPPEDEGPTPAIEPEVCIPANIVGNVILLDPFPRYVGTLATLSATVTGTLPITYEWFIFSISAGAYVSVASTETYEFTITSDMVAFDEETGVGGMAAKLTVTNCGTETAEGTFVVEPTP